MYHVGTRVEQGASFAGARHRADVYGFMTGWWSFASPS